MSIHSASGCSTSHMDERHSALSVSLLSIPAPHSCAGAARCAPAPRDADTHRRGRPPKGGTPAGCDDSVTASPLRTRVQRHPSTPAVSLPCLKRRRVAGGGSSKQRRQRQGEGGSAAHVERAPSHPAHATWTHICSAHPCPLAVPSLPFPSLLSSALPSFASDVFRRDC